MFKKLFIVLFAALVIAGVSSNADAMYGLEKYWFSVVDEEGQSIVSGYEDIDILVYDTGTSDKATIYSDAQGTSKSQTSAWNPTATGVAEFYTSASSVDIVVVNDDVFTVETIGATVYTHRVRVRDISAITGLAGVKSLYEVVATDDTLTAADTGKSCIASAAATFTLPAAAVGLEYTIIDGSGATVYVDPASTADTIKYLTLSAGDKLTSPGATGDSVTLICGAANTWYISGMKGSWTDGN